METSELIKKVRKIEIKTRGLSKNLFSGEYHSAFKGQGMSFSEVREYQYGDDVRNIDWNVTAKTGTPHIKIFEEERELSVFLLMDVSGSTFTGGRSGSRQDFMTELSAVFAFSALQNNDKVGLILFAEDVQLFIPPKKGKKHVLRLIRELVNQEQKGVATNITEALKTFDNVVNKRSVAFLISDFYAGPKSYEDALRIVAKKHDLVGVQVTDDWDEALPNVGLLEAVDAESGAEYIIDSSSVKIRTAHHRRYLEKQSELKSLFSQIKSDWLELRLGRPYIPRLLQFFKQRAARK